MNSGVVVSADAARAPLKIDPEARTPWMRVTGQISDLQFSNIVDAEHDDQLVIVIDSFAGFGRTVRFSGQWSHLAGDEFTHVDLTLLDAVSPSELIELHVGDLQNGYFGNVFDIPLFH